MKTFDVAIIGAGPAGAVAARHLAQSGHEVLLIDDAPHTLKIGESLPGSAYPLLCELGLLPWLQASEPMPCLGNIVAWGEAPVYYRDFMREPHGAGWHLERQSFDALLRKAACEAGVIWFKQRLQQVKRMGSHWWLALSDESVCARWLIDASGRRSILARRLGVRRERDQPLIALYARSHSTGVDQRTCIEAVANGWWYSAPLPHQQRIAALHVTPAQAQKVLKDTSGWFSQLDQTHHIQAHSCATQWAQPQACEASGSYLQHFAGEQWLAVGDAALAYDPLSSQGIFNALYTAMRGAQAVQAAFAGKRDAIEQYTGKLLSVRQAYVRNLDFYYRNERRWADQEFWWARQQ